MKNMKNTCVCHIWIVHRINFNIHQNFVRYQIKLTILHCLHHVRWLSTILWTLFISDLFGTDSLGCSFNSTFSQNVSEQSSNKGCDSTISITSFFTPDNAITLELQDPPSNWLFSFVILFLLGLTVDIFDWPVSCSNFMFGGDVESFLFNFKFDLKLNTVSSSESFDGVIQALK